MPHSIGKDSCVMLHLARNALFPERLPFPLLHIDTTWKFRDMIYFRDRVASMPDIELSIHTNREGLARRLTPVDGSALYTHFMKTEALKQALEVGGCDAAIRGARRGQERSRAKERVFSFWTAAHIGIRGTNAPGSGRSVKRGSVLENRFAAERSPDELSEAVLAVLAEAPTMPDCRSA